MHPFSDSDTSDSEDGIRFKTQSTRNKETTVKEQRRRSPDHRSDSRRRRSRSRSLERRRQRSRSRERHRHKKHKRDRDRHDKQSTSRSYDSGRSGRSHRNVPENAKDDVSEERSSGRSEGKDCSKRIESGHRIAESSTTVLQEACEGNSNKQSLLKQESIDVESKDEDDAYGPNLPPNIRSKDNIDSTTNCRNNLVIELQENSELDANVKPMQVSGGRKTNESDESEESIVGPVLPPYTQKNTECEESSSSQSNNLGLAKNIEIEEDSSSNTSEDETGPNLNIGPTLPAHLQLKGGPSLPPHVQQKEDVSNIGPSLPPHLQQKEDVSNIGPTLPPKGGSSTIGPSLPPHLQQKEDISDIGPSLPSHLLLKETVTSIGPSLPPHLLTKSEDDLAKEADSYGPSLPPTFTKTDEPKCIGPTLPAHLREKLINNEDIEEENDDDDDDYGPLPIGANPKTSAHLALEERALQMKLDKLNPAENSKPAREEWMMELPAAAARIGLGARQFRAKEGPDMSDRSSWTDTPQDKEKKKKKEKPLDLKEEAELQELKKRDKEQEAIIKDHKKKKKRDKSLLEQHQEKLKKKKEEELSAGNVRRPFSRDIDLKVNHFDEAQKKAIFKKAQLLDDRFSKGQSKYL